MNTLLSRSRSCSPPPPSLNPWHEAVHFSCRFSESLSLPLPKALVARFSSSGRSRGSPPSFLPSFLPPCVAKHCSPLTDGDGLTNGETTDEAPFLISASATASIAGGR